MITARRLKERSLRNAQITLPLALWWFGRWIYSVKMWCEFIERATLKILQFIERAETPKPNLPSKTGRCRLMIYSRDSKNLYPSTCLHWRWILTEQNISLFLHD